MEQSDQIGDLAAALAAARLKFDAIKKDRAGQVGQAKYKYATLDSVLGATDAAMGEHGLALLQSVTAEVRGSGDATSAWCVCVTLLAHASGQWVRTSSEAPIEPEYNAGGRPVLSPVQDMGKVATYLRRYAATAILGVTADEDSDGAKRPEPPREPDRRPDRRPDPPPPKPAPKPAPKPTEAPAAEPDASFPPTDHHASWEADRKAFCGALRKLGHTYDGIAAWCVSIGRPRPSAMDQDGRNRLFRAIDKGGKMEHDPGEWLATHDVSALGAAE